MRLSREDYVARIASADQIQLVIINYELLIDYLRDSIESFGKDSFGSFLKKAQSSLELLMDSLDMKYDLSRDLMRLYIYVKKLIISAQFEKNTNGLAEAIDIMNELLSCWEKLAVSELGGAAIMENGQRIVAGLTYKNGELSEIVLGDSNRGYQA